MGFLEAGRRGRTIEIKAKTPWDRHTRRMAVNQFQVSQSEGRSLRASWPASAAVVCSYLVVLYAAPLVPFGLLFLAPVTAAFLVKRAHLMIRVLVVLASLVGLVGGAVFGPDVIEPTNTHVHTYAG